MALCAHSDMIKVLYMTRPQLLAPGLIQDLYWFRWSGEAGLMMVCWLAAVDHVLPRPALTGAVSA